MRWVFTAALISMIIKAMCLRARLRPDTQGKWESLLYIDAYQDLKLEICIACCQLVCLTFTADTMLISDVTPQNLLEPHIANKFWLLRGQGLHQNDSLFVDGLSVIAILVYFSGLMRCFTTLQTLFISLEQSMRALFRWFIFLNFMLSILALSNMTLYHLSDSEHNSFGRAFISLFYAQDKIPGQQTVRDASHYVYTKPTSWTESGLHIFNTAVWSFSTLYFMYGIALSVLFDTYRTVMLQTREGRSHWQKKIYCSSTTRKGRVRKGWQRDQRRAQMAWWHFLAWISSWLPESVNRIVRRRTDRQELEELDELERELDLELRQLETLQSEQQKTEEEGAPPGTVETRVDTERGLLDSHRSK